MVNFQQLFSPIINQDNQKCSALFETYYKELIEYNQKVKRGYDNALITGKYAVIRFIFKNINKPVFIKDIQAYFKP